MVVITQAKSCGSVSSKSSSESEEYKVFNLPLVFVGNKLFKVLLGDVRFAFMIHVEKEFLSGKEFIDSESSGFDGDCH